MKKVNVLIAILLAVLIIASCKTSYNGSCPIEYGTKKVSHSGLHKKVK